MRQPLGLAEFLCAMECFNPVSKDLASALLRIAILECVSSRAVLRMKAEGHNPNYSSFVAGCGLGLAIAVEMGLNKNDCMSIGKDVDKLIALGRMRKVE